MIPANKARLLRIVLLLAILFSSSQVVRGDEDVTGVLLGKTTGFMAQNGRTWQTLDKQAKIMFLNGIQDGAVLLFKELFATNDSEDAHRVLGTLVISGFRFSDIVKQVDMFYSDSANIRVPVIEAYRYSLIKMKGSQNSELERIVTKLRQTYNQEP
jgi:hypothetical protein